MFNMASVVPLPSMSIITTVFGVWVAGYLVVLLALNTIPHVSVRSIGWLCFKHVIIEYKSTKVYVGLIKLKFNIAWSADAPFRMINVVFANVEVTCTGSGEKGDEKEEHKKKLDEIPTNLSFSIPYRVYDVLFCRKWLNEVAIHCHHLSYTHTQVHEHISFHLDYFRVEGLHALDLGDHCFALSAMDGYVKDHSEANPQQIRLFHNLEWGITYSMLFWCSMDTKKYMVAQITNMGFSFSVGDLYIPRLPHIFNKSRKPQQSPNKDLPMPSMHTCLGILNLISSIQVKIEQSVVEYKELRLESSSYTINFTKDTSFKQQTVAKVSSYITAGKLMHLDLKCIEIPSLTYLFETNLTDVYRAYNAGENLYFIDLTTSLNITNPAFNLFFDQFSYLMDLFNSNRSSEDVGTPERKISKDNLIQICELLKKFRKASAKMVVTDAKGTLHTPGIDQHEFHRESMKNIVTNAGITFVAIRSSSKNLGRLIERKCMGGSVPLTIKSYLKMKNIHLEVSENEIFASNFNTLIGYCVDTNSIGLKMMSKRLHIRSVNAMIFHVIRRVQEARINYFNKACAKIDIKDYQKSLRVPDNFDKDTIQEVFVDIFSILPPIITSVKFKSTLFSLIIICHDALPSHIMYERKLDSYIDLGDLKRGVSFTLNELSVNYKMNEESFRVEVRQIQANTMSDHAIEYIEDFDQVTHSALGEIDFDDVSSFDSQGESIADNDDSVNKVKRVMFINDLVIENPKRTRDRLLVQIPEIDGRIDIFLVWCLMYARTLVEMISPKVAKQYSQKQVQQLKDSSKKVHLDIQIDSIAVVARIVHNVDVMVEVDLLNLQNVFDKPQCQIRYCRLFVIHPNTQLWTRLVSIADTFVDLDNLSGTTFTLSSKCVRFNIPFQYLVYTVIDNVITFFKAIRQVKHNFKNLSANNDNFVLILPDAVEAIKMPRVRWQAKTFGITLENDAFEAELAMIYELGAIEQIERIRKWAYFEEKEKEIKNKVRETLSKKSVASRRFMSSQDPRKHTVKMRFNVADIGPSISESFKMRKSGSTKSTNNQTPDSETSNPAILTSNDKHNHVKSTPSGSTIMNSEVDLDANEPIMTEIRAWEIISAAKKALEKDFATSWIQKYRKFKESRYKNWDERSRNLWGEDEINMLIKSKFKIQEYAPGALQFCGLFKDFDLIVDDPKINDIHKFLYDYGKSQPKLEYSILIPIFVHLRSSAVYFSIKDYVLPLLSFPSNVREDIPVMDFLGRIVINEKLVHMKEEMRHIFVPFSPAVVDPSENDNFYSAHIIRTLTPIKFMFDLKCNLKTDRACIISWSKSYLPAISSIMSSFDNFTKPEIDDSPLGWWDKVALIAHGKIKFNIENELCFHIKSSTSPYKLVGENSGFVFCWKNNVSLRINETSKSSEIIILESDDFILGIPNYSTAEKRTWSLFYSDLHDYVHDNESESRKFLKRVMKFSSDEKVCWKLGFLFEKNVDKNATDLSSNQKRTNQFKPHYDVRVTSPEFSWHPDSYENYRSDYIHMAISVKSKSAKGNSYNAAYFTPLTFQYFFAWWHTLSNTISLPIREGSLFSRHMDKKSLVKMGPHLFTFKYQLDIEPLTISHIYISSANIEQGQNVISTGLKGKCTRCVIDLHQRKEVVRYVNEKLGINKKIRKLKLNLGEIDVTDADIRLIHASFSDKSLRAQLLASYASETSDPTDDESLHEGMSDLSDSDAKMNNTDWVRGLSITGGDFLWLDQEDFVELEERQILSADPKVDIVPFFFTPKFTFFREFTLEVPEGNYPFGNEKSHDCLIGAQPPEKVQAMLLERRAKTLQQELKENINALEQLEEINNPVFNHDYERIKSEIAENEERIDKVKLIYEEVKSASRPASLLDPSLLSTNGIDLSEASSQFSMKRVESHQPSLHPSFRSLEDAREVTSVNTSVSDYHNRFLIHNLQLKWNNQIRDLFMTYLLLVGNKKTSSFAMTKKAVDLVNNLLKNVGRDNESTTGQEPRSSEMDEKVSHYFNSGDDVINGFDEYLENLDGEGQEIEFKYLIKLIRPQVQMISDADLTSCILETSQQVEMRILCVNLEGTNDIISEGAEETSLVETRYGVFFQDSHLFAFEKSKFHDDSTNPYCLPSKKKKSWPPWVDLEVCDDSSWLEDNLIVERTSMTLSLKKPNLLLAETSDQPRSSELVVNLSKFVFSATSLQYSAMYFVITDLLMHSKSVRDAFHKRLDHILAVTELSDYIGLSEKVKQLQVNIRVCRNILLKMDERSVLLSDHEKRQKAHVEIELERMKLDLDLIVSSLKTLGSKVSRSQLFRRNWHFRADQVIWHFLDDNREPLVDLALATSLFIRVDHYDGSNTNAVEVSMIQGFNLKPNAVYPELLRPYLEILEDKKNSSLCQPEEPMIRMTWKMLNPVGGIRVMSNAQLQIQPIHIQLDYNCATKMFAYLFPKDESRRKEDSSTLPDESDNQDAVSVDSQTSTSELLSNPFRKLIGRRRSGGSPTSPASRTSSMSSKREEVLEVSSGESSGASNNTSLTELHGLHGLHGLKQNNSLKKRRGKQKENNVDDFALIMCRSSKYFVIGEVEVKKMKLCISFKAPKHLNIIDVHNLQLTVPLLHYKNKTWTGADFANQVKKDIIRIVLSHSGKIIGNKFKKRHRKATSSPLKQISDYSRYTSLDDLQVGGRSRDEKHVSLQLGANGTPRIRIPGIKTPSTQKKRDQKQREMVNFDEVLETLSEGVLTEEDEEERSSDEPLIAPAST